MKHPSLLHLFAITVVSAAAAQTANLQSRTTSALYPPPLVFGPARSVISAKPHAPFSAVLVEQMEQLLNDGTTITRENQETVARDGMGRVYRARSLKGLTNAEHEPKVLITITDPVRLVQYVCTAIKICRQLEYRVPAWRAHRLVPDAAKQRDVTVEDLGASNVAGIQVEGKRITRVIPEGMVGNDRPFTTVEELWDSKELDVDVQVKRVDPRTGTCTTTLTEVNVGEPDQRLFQIPEGYRLMERKSSFGALAPFPATAQPK